MELPEGGTLFAEMGTTYEELCQAEHPAEKIMNHGMALGLRRSLT